ncbi:hypothetical protein BFP72_16485 [Reichenbachiella sp. 5M10]|uniref:hypothetical protein n=1 Tax=Reichenbachiella sp. 5M10 TaxID=1889772 RepID=UPI000C15E3FD|nr:hypothetical protein [Reichenbachiella sp. 5M10]PIB36885.1 hypothetical protein BFP72_16485 [Reichenbachiella sp. 5M10]
MQLVGQGNVTVRWFKIILWIWVLVSATVGYAQDTLVLHSGRRVPFTRMSLYDDAVEVKDYEEQRWELYPPDSILGYSQALKEETYFLIQPEEVEGYVFAERHEVGELTLYVDDQSGYRMYVERAGQFACVYDGKDNQREHAVKLERFVELVADDEESLAYVQAATFKYRPREIEKVIAYYNERNYTVQTLTDETVRGTIYLYRTRFQKTKKRIKIRQSGRYHELYINDFIQLHLPINYPTKLLLYDGSIQTEILVSGGLRDRFYEVLYDARSDDFRLDEKDGTELHYEFYGIKEKVGEKMAGD